MMMKVFSMIFMEPHFCYVPRHCRCRGNDVCGARGTGRLGVSDDANDTENRCGIFG